MGDIDIHFTLNIMSACKIVLLLLIALLCNISYFQVFLTSRIIPKNVIVGDWLDKSTENLNEGFSKVNHVSENNFESFFPQCFVTQIGRIFLLYGLFDSHC